MSPLVILRRQPRRHTPDPVQTEGCRAIGITASLLVADTEGRNTGVPGLEYSFDMIYACVNRGGTQWEIAAASNGPKQLGIPRPAVTGSRVGDNRYALTLAKRLKAMGQPRYQQDGDPRTSGPGFGVTLHPEALRLPLTWSRPRLVFVNSMSDLFHARVPLTFVKEVFDVMTETPQHTYQLLTKRARRLRRLAPELTWPDLMSGWEYR